MSIKPSDDASAKILADCLKAGKALVYGRGEYHYKDLENLLKTEHKIDICRETSMLTEYSWLPHNPDSRYSLYKDFLVYHVFENWQRSLEDLPPFPIWFCIGSQNPGSQPDTDDPAPLLITSKHITSRDKEQNVRVSSKELRRVYKLCNDPLVDPEIRKVARESFVYLEVEQDMRYSPPSWMTVKKVPSPFDSPSWAKDYAERQGSKQPKAPKGRNWREALNSAVLAHRSHRLEGLSKENRRTILDACQAYGLDGVTGNENTPASASAGTRNFDPKMPPSSASPQPSNGDDSYD